ADHRLSRSVRRKIEVAADARQARWIREIGELDLAGDLGVVLSGLKKADRPIGGDGDRLSVRRNCDLRLEGIPIRRHHISVAVEVERARPGVGGLASGPPYLKEPAALNHKVERIVGLREVSLSEDDLIGRGARAKTQLKARGHDGLLSGRSAGLYQVLVHQVLKLGASRFKASRIRVGQVVSDIVDVQLLSR